MATTQPVKGWPGKRKYDPYDERFEPASVGEWVESSTALQLKLFEEAGRNGADLVVGTEGMRGLTNYAVYLRDRSIFRKHLETIPGPTSRRIGAISKRYRMYIVACYYEKVGPRCYNTAVLFGRNGRIMGKYRKHQLTTNERWFCTPGNSFPVFKTEMGNIGIAICYDMQFPEIIRCLTLSGADIICFPTGGYGRTEDIGDSCMKTRCVDYGVYLILSHFKRSQIVTPWGDVLADAGHRANVVAYADVDTSAGQLIEPNNYWTIVTGTSDYRERLVKERRPELYKLITQKNPAVLKRYKRKGLAEKPEEVKEIFEKIEKDKQGIARGLAKKYV